MMNSCYREGILPSNQYGNTVEKIPHSMAILLKKFPSHRLEFVW